MRSEQEVTIAILALEDRTSLAVNTLEAATVASRRAALIWVTGEADAIISPLVER